MQARRFLERAAAGALRLIGPVLLYLALGQLTAYACVALLAFCRYPAPNRWVLAMELYDRHALAFSMVWAAVSFLPLYRWYQKEQSWRGRTRAIGPLEDGAWYDWAILGVSGCLICNGLMQLAPPGLADGYGEAARRLFAPGLFTQALAMGVVMPCVEELVFRGLAYGNCRDVVGFWTAAASSSLMFGLFHGNLLQGAYAFLLGMLLAWIHERGGTLIAPIVAHGSANLASVLLGAEPVKRWASEGRVMAGLSALSAAAGLWCFWKLAKKEEIQ